MSRRPPRTPLAASNFSNECHRCGRDIEAPRDATKVKGRWIHKTCHGGDE